MKCDHPMRGGLCNMDAGHKGRHSTVAWRCDGCGETRRSYPSAWHPEAGRFCFMCVELVDYDRLLVEREDS
jgi:hypothetical protein